MRAALCAFCAVVAPVALAVSPDVGQGILGGGKDIEMTVAPGSNGQSKLNFMSLGDRPGVYTLLNHNNGTMQLQRNQRTLVEIEDDIEKDTTETAVLLDESSLLDAVHSARIARRRLRRAGTSRQLLEEPEDSMDAMKEDTHLAKRIRAVGKFRSTGAVASTASGNVRIFGQRQWKMLAHEDFHQETVEGWKNKGEAVDLPPDNSISECSSQKHTYSDYFLGSFTNMETSKTFLLPAHTHVRVQARVHFIDDWQGESVWLKLDDQIVWIKEHKWCNQLIETMCRPRRDDDAEDQGFTLNVCGDPNFPDQLSVQVDASVTHSSDALKVTFGSNVREGEGEDSSRVATWGVDDVKVHVM